MSAHADANGRNRRRNLRVAVELPVAWRNTHDGETRVSSTVDLSASGMALRSPVRLPAGTMIYAVVGHAKFGLRFETAATIRRVRGTDGHYVAVVVFEPLPQETAAEVGRFVVCALAGARGAAATG